MVESVVDDGALGLTTFQRQAPNSHLKTRWNKDLHRDEVRCLSVTSKVQKQQGTGQASLLQYYTEDPSKADITGWKSGQASRVTLRKKVTWVPIAR